MVNPCLAACASRLLPNPTDTAHGDPHTAVLARYRRITQTFHSLVTHITLTVRTAAYTHTQTVELVNYKSARAQTVPIGYTRQPVAGTGLRSLGIWWDAQTSTPPACERTTPWHGCWEQWHKPTSPPYAM